MIHVNPYVMVVLIELYPFIPLSVTLIVFQGHSSLKVLIKFFMFLSDDHIETLYDC